MKNVLLGLSIVICFFVAVNSVKAETLNEYIAKAEAALKNERATADKKEMTEEEKEAALAEKEQITNDIINTEKEISQLEKDIKDLEDSIEKKDEQIKDIMHFVQVSEGSSTYLEYAFGASTFTDFIYRVSVAEQLSSYNDDLINEYNADIKSLEQKQKDLTTKQAELQSKQAELEELIDKLAKEIDELNDSVQSYQAEYNNLMQYVNTLRNMGCRGDEDMASCQNRINPPSVSGGSNGFYIPLTKGKVTQNYYGRSHNAIDISNYEGAPVYAITSGTVIAISRNQSCGKNIVYIIHNVNGADYTTVYYHLKTVNVSVGQGVNYTTQIGTQGGNPSYDSCTSGSHLDFKLFKGRYLRDFFSLTSGPHMDPRNWLPQLPGEGQRFYSR